VHWLQREDLGRSARALGIDRFVMKPVVGAELVQVIRAALDRVSC
jgi:DNA-binding response OmpR family regulator